MSRTVTINYRRVTLSLPKKVVEDLKEKTEKNKMSSYITDLIIEDLARKGEKEESVEEFLESMKDLRKTIKKHEVDKRPTIEILREIRYGKDA